MSPSRRSSRITRSSRRHSAVSDARPSRHTRHCDPARSLNGRARGLRRRARGQASRGRQEGFDHSLPEDQRIAGLGGSGRRRRHRARGSDASSYSKKVAYLTSRHPGIAGFAHWRDRGRGSSDLGCGVDAEGRRNELACNATAGASIIVRTTSRCAMIDVWSVGTLGRCSVLDVHLERSNVLAS